jgi:hypothetical protein
MKKTIILCAIVLLAACTKAIIVSPEAKQVRVVTAASQKRHCELIKIVSATQLIGPDKKGDAMKLAINDAAALGANAFYVDSVTEAGGIKGTTVAGEALRCKFWK